jgi:hypothetical protein
VENLVEIPNILDFSFGEFCIKNIVAIVNEDVCLTTMFCILIQCMDVKMGELWKIFKRMAKLVHLSANRQSKLHISYCIHFQC